MQLTKKNLVFLGAPGAGKGTISKKLLAEYPLAHISTGDILRAEVAAGTPAGKEAEALMKAGKLVSDELVAGMVRNRIAQPDCDNGFILDGFPRTVHQADLLAEALKDAGKTLDQVIYFKVDDDELIQRLTARLNCKGCDAIYNKRFMPPKVEGICDKCGAQLFQRADDSLETAQSRLKVFYAQTSPLIEYYSERGMLLTMNSANSDEIVVEMIEALK